MTAKFQGHALHTGSWAKYSRASPRPGKSFPCAWAVKSHIKLQLGSPQPKHAVSSTGRNPEPFTPKLKVFIVSKSWEHPVHPPDSCLPSHELCMVIEWPPLIEDSFLPQLKINITLTLNPFSSWMQRELGRLSKTGTHLFQDSD